jgi:outer membrane lipoprotein carrier protein
LSNCKKLYLNILLITACFLVLNNIALSSEHDEAALTMLKDYISTLESFNAGFEQILYGQSGDTLERTAGIVKLQKPAKFYWEYQQPYNQFLISNGETLWIYDEDLEQVTINNVDNNIQNSPAALLSGEIDIKENYTVINLGKLDEHDWIELKSLKSDAEISSLRLAFFNGELSRMILFDSLGQTTELNFQDVLRDQKNVDAIFEFIPPQGIDVIDTRDIE